MINSTKCLIIASCIALIMSHKSPSEALLLGNFIGCNSFGCRLSALESDVAALKQVVARLDPSGNMSNYPRPTNMPFNQNGMTNPNNMNQQLGGQMSNINPQQQGGQMSNINPQQQGGQMSNINPQQQGGQMSNINPQQQGGQMSNGNQQQQGGPSVNFAWDPAMNNQNIRRTSGYQSNLNNGQQFLRA